MLVILFLQSMPATTNAQQILEVNIDVVGLNTNQITALNQLSNACASSSNSTDEQAIALQEVCNFADTLDQTNSEDISALQAIADAVAPEEAFSIDDSLIIGSDYQVVNVNARLNALRSKNVENQSSSENTLSINNVEKFRFLHDDQTGGGASLGFVPDLGGFISGHTSSAELEGGTLQQDAQYKFNNLTLGTDHRLNEHVILGLGVGFMQDETQFNQSTVGTDSEGFNVTAYASWFESDQGYVDVVLDMGLIDYELERSISTSSNNSIIALANPKVSARSLTISGGRHFTPMGYSVSGYFRMALTRSTIDAYTESLRAQNSEFTPLFSINERSVTSSEIVLGMEVSKALSTPYAVIVPRLRLEYVKENDRSKDDIEATLISTGTLAEYQGQDREASYSNLGIGASAVFTRGRSAYAYYETHLQHNLISQDTIKIGVRLEF